MQTEVLVGMGANLGDPVAQLCRAVAALRRFADVQSVSAVYRTEPVGYRDQPDFFNLACRGRTALDPLGLLHAVRQVEGALGRERTFRNAPRIIDVDVLDFGGAVLDTAQLTLPHPRLHQRSFVLVPLLDVAPHWRHPVLGLTVHEMVDALERVERVERWGVLPASC